MKKINIRPLSDIPNVGETFVTSDSKYRGRTISVDTFYPSDHEESNMFRVEIFDFESKSYRWSTLCVA